eukprot:700702-Karenia_brevis.AAC.1
MKPRSCPSYSRVPPPELSAWISSFAVMCIRAVRGYINRASPRSGPFSNGWWNTSCLVNLGFKLLRLSSWVPVPADKDVGFALIRKRDIPHILRAALRPQWYTEDPW